MEKIPAERKEVVSAWFFVGRADVGDALLGTCMLHRNHKQWVRLCCVISVKSLRLWLSLILAPASRRRRGSHTAQLSICFLRFLLQQKRGSRADPGAFLLCHMHVPLVNVALSRSNQSYPHTATFTQDLKVFVLWEESQHVKVSEMLSG